MSGKMECVGCASYTSAIADAFDLGAACPNCGLPAEAAAAVRAARRAIADERLIERCLGTERRAAEVEKELALLRHRMAMVVEAMSSTPDEGKMHMQPDPRKVIYVGVQPPPDIRLEDGFIPTVPNADNHIGPAWNMHPIAEAAYNALPVDSCGQTFVAEHTDDGGVRRHAFGHPEPVAARVAAEVLRALDAWLAAGNTYTSLTALAEEIAP